MAAWSGFHPCTCIAVDAQAYSRNDDRRQSEIQHDLPRLLSRAADGAGLNRSQWHLQPKGDEELAVYPMDGTEPRLVDDFVRHLVWELGEYNRSRISASRLRLRLAVDHGPVEVAPNGFAGATVVSVSRLLNSAHLYEALRQHEPADLAVLLSDHVYRSTVGSGHTTLSREDFREVAVQVKEYESVAWLRIPGGNGFGPGPRPADTATASSVSPSRSHGSATESASGHHYRADRLNVNNFAGPVDLRGGTVGFGGSNG
ncbi:hypothetical protein [Streptomyces sp. NPDC008139]|uniref:hypothetical protein n=1 Tax=Streptomyces sp. NPDC008139 TaxID=3364814 RepID=UPI0036EBF027